MRRGGRGGLDRGRLERAKRHARRSSIPMEARGSRSEPPSKMQEQRAVPRASPPRPPGRPRHPASALHAASVMTHARPFLLLPSLLTLALTLSPVTAAQPATSNGLSLGPRAATARGLRRPVPLARSRRPRSSPPRPPRLTGSGVGDERHPPRQRPLRRSGDGDVDHGR